jgi:uncharacterized protein (DUF952 family)
LILHIIDKNEWSKTKSEGMYAPSSLKTDGFIHCSTAEQVIDVANFLYKGAQGLALLFINENKVISKIVYEDLYQSGKLFSHIYGVLNLNAVFKVPSFEPNKDGCFELPYDGVELNT